MNARIKYSPQTETGKFRESEQGELMKRLFQFVCLMVLFPATLALAQTDYPKAELFGGYSYFNADGGDVLDRQNFNGWGASITGNINRVVGITAQFAGEYGSVNVDVPVGRTTARASADFRAYGFLFGPEFSYRSPKARVFFHPLVGGLHSKVSGGSVNVGGTTVPVPELSESATDFGWAVGAGVDLAAHRLIAIRLFQFDYVGQKSDPIGNHFRIATGIVFRLGGQ